jgi:hypothetical protein
MKAFIWGEVVRPAIADHEGWVLFIGTPHGIDMFSERYDHAVVDDEWCAHMFRCDETNLPWLPPAELESIRKDLTKNQWRQEMLCDFAASNEDVIITIDTVSDCMKRVTPSAGYLKGMEKVVGIDPAWMGGDSTAVAFRWGLHLYPIRVFPREQHDQIVMYLGQLYEQHDPDAWFMDEAYSEYIYKRAEGLGINIHLVAFGGEALRKTQYANRVTEMFFRFNDWCLAGGVISCGSTTDEQEEANLLKAELTSVTYEVITVGKHDVRRRHKKDLIKQKIGRSPDRADAAVLTCADVVIAKESRQAARTVEVSDGDYHPHKKLRRKTQARAKQRRTR